MDIPTEKQKSPAKLHPFRRAVLRGLAVVLPPLLTIILFLWGWNLIQRYVLEPVEGLTRRAIVLVQQDIRTDVHTDQEKLAYREVWGKKWIPAEIYDTVQANPGEPPPITAEGYYDRYINIRYLRRTRVIPLFMALFILVLYLVGKSLAAGMGRLIVVTVERLIQRLPVIRNVYGSVKQVTDFIFSEQSIEFNRVVAVEYPRRGVWSIGFVTGESMLDISSAANEPVLTVLMPTSPMPATGFTITVRKSETIDLNITVDQAIQFIVSCGVVVPAQQQYKDQEDNQFGPSSVRPTLARIGSAAADVSPSPNGGDEAARDGTNLEKQRE